jgi:hypothetical protein
VGAVRQGAAVSKTAGAIWRSPFLEFRRRPPLQIFESALKEKFEPAVVVPRECRHYAFLANFAPVTLVEHVADTREHSGSPLPKLKFGREIPNVIGGNEAFEGIAIVTELIVNERAKKRDFERIFVAIDRAGFDLVIRCI